MTNVEASNSRGFVISETQIESRGLGVRFAKEGSRSESFVIYMDWQPATSEAVPLSYTIVAVSIPKSVSKRARK
jgi:hypothetical protein